MEAQKHIYKVDISGYICVEAKSAREAVKVVRNWTHKIVTEAEGDEPYDYHLSDAPLVHIEPDHNHAMGIYTQYDGQKQEFEVMKAEAKAYRKRRILPALPKKLRDKMNADDTE